MRDYRMSTSPCAALEAGHQELADSFERFITRELVPLAAEHPESGDSPPSDISDYVRQRSAQLGFYACDYPESVGGSGAPLIAFVMLHHVAGRSGCHLAPYALARVEGPSKLLLCGTQKQREHYLAPLVRGEKTRCVAMTEPGGGSDGFTMATSAVPRDGGWVINGRKVFISNADRAGFAVVFAATSDRGGTAGSTAFVIDTGTPGLRVGQRFTGMSGDPLFELVLDDVWVSGEAILGGPDGLNAAGRQGMHALAQARIALAAECNGIAEHALRLAVRYAQERKVFGQQIGTYQHVQEHLVASRVELESAKLLTMACARLLDEGADAPENAALAKLVASETAVRTVERALRVHGATAWIRGHPLERLYRYVRMTTIVDGTSEIQKVIIARSMGLG
jgi:alkylation response protein AidB-like acyl-CoA dehydrogenase